MLSPFLHAQSPIFGHLKMSTFPIYIFVFDHKCGSPVLAAEVIKAKLTFNASQILFQYINTPAYIKVVQTFSHFMEPWNCSWQKYGEQCFPTLSYILIFHHNPQAGWLFHFSWTFGKTFSQTFYSNLLICLHWLVGISVRDIS